MAFPNLDKCSCGSPRAPKVSLGSHGLGANSKFSLGSKRSGSLKNKSVDIVDFVAETNRKNSVISSQHRFEGSATTNQNEYTKTSLDRPSQQERSKRRQLVQQIISSSDQNGSGLTSKDASTSTKVEKLEKANSPSLDPSDDVFVNYYKQVRSANKTFSTFLGPPTPPQKYLKDDDMLIHSLQQSKSNSQNLSNLPENMVPGEDSDDQQEKTSEYTPLSFDTNYVKVSPPKLTRRQKKSGGSESDASREPPKNPRQSTGVKKVRKDKAQSPKESGRKPLPCDDDANISDRPNSSGSDRDGSSSTRNSDVFAEDDNHLPLPPPAPNFDRENLSSHDSEEFPPPPPSATWETTSDYISLENAEKRALLSQSSDDSPSSTSRYQPSKGIIKNVVSLGSTLPKSEGVESTEPLIQTREEIPEDKEDNSILEFKLTVRLGGTNKVTSKDLDGEQSPLASLSDMKTSIVSEKSEAVDDDDDLKSAIVAEICQVVSKSLTKDKFGKGQLLNALQKTEHSSPEHLTKSFQNSAYGIPNDLLLSFEKFKSNTPLVSHKTITKSQHSDDASPESKKENSEDGGHRSNLEEFERIKSLQKSKRKTLADFVSSKVTTVAQVHHSADDILAGEKQTKNNSIFSLVTNTSTNDDEPLDLIVSKRPQHVKQNRINEKPQADGQLKSSKQTHMNWDDLMEEAKSLGIPLSRPCHSVTSTTITKKQNSCDTILEMENLTYAGQKQQQQQQQQEQQQQQNIKIIQDKTRPISSDSAVGTSVSSVCSVTGLTQTKNNAPKLISHKAALQQAASLAGTCCCGHDKSRRENRVDFNKCECCCRANLHSKSSAALGQTSRTERKFNFFKDRLKLSNFFCKRFCSKSVERATVASNRQSSQCSCAKSGSQGHSNGGNQSQLPSKQTVQGHSTVRDKNPPRTCPQKVSNLRGANQPEKDFEAEAAMEEGGFSTSCKDQGSIDRCFHSMNNPGYKSNPTSRRRQSDENNLEGSNSPTSNWSPNDLFKNLEEIRKHGWYWGPIGFEEAESLLSAKKDGSFLVRDSSDDRYILSLSFRSQGGTHHTRIGQHKGKFSFFSHSNSHEASSVDEFIANAMKLSSEGKSLYYLRPKSSNSLPIPVQLLYPVIRPMSPGKVHH